MGVEGGREGGRVVAVNAWYVVQELSGEYNTSKYVEVIHVQDIHVKLRKL